MESTEVRALSYKRFVESLKNEGDCWKCFNSPIVLLVLSSSMCLKAENNYSIDENAFGPFVDFF